MNKSFFLKLRENKFNSRSDLNIIHDKIYIKKIDKIFTIEMSILLK